MSKDKDSNKQEELYDDVYFDSEQELDQETMGIGLPNQQKPKQQQKKRVLSNDELLYDPDMDDEDEAWVSKQIAQDSSRTDQNIPIEAKTDAILTCPMCFTTLCYSCQRHEKYADQFRAMFVRNCHTVPGERYKFKSDDGQEEYYQKVTCETCGIQVAMLDQEEVYHFFNVVAT
ncbi:E2F-associated phosphoprotein-domain-containing protein [Gilbertella persicaria]|uniref:E2F-associated phosphoprotein-domain-containing protein n=1 Tax=Gilbertella persicaria TaxID=101096 RepID=UPI002220F595|nr:E2F-associated phosphoprotein-domain-containing protein [Gilbertella persicaria]KAI8054199.1 E2F-associated phosphoprotein-domain-containing protein [Gilbertella persicaria]